MPVMAAMSPGAAGRIRKLCRAAIVSFMTRFPYTATAASAVNVGYYCAAWNSAKVSAEMGYGRAPPP